MRKFPSPNCFNLFATGTDKVVAWTPGQYSADPTERGITHWQCHPSRGDLAESGRRQL